jgi:hypothetical protein
VYLENLDLGRPESIQLIFDRRVTKRTPGEFRTRVVREGVGDVAAVAGWISQS